MVLEILGFGIGFSPKFGFGMSFSFGFGSFKVEVSVYLGFYFLAACTWALVMLYSRLTKFRVESYISQIRLMLIYLRGGRNVENQNVEGQNIESFFRMIRTSKITSWKTWSKITLSKVLLDFRRSDHFWKIKTDQNVENDLPMAFGLLNLT